MDCINLRERYSGEYRIRLEPGMGLVRDPWHYQVAGRRGHICPWGGELLACCLNEGHPVLSVRLMSEPWVVRSLGNKDGVNALFEAGDFLAAAEYIKAYRRRSYTPEQLKAAQEMARENFNLVEGE